MKCIKLPSKVMTILRVLSGAGYEAYAVGGCVRDSLLGRTPGDWDITTSALPQEVKALFRRTVDTGLQHGTVTVLLGGEGFEVTTYRIDGDYSDSRHPDQVRFTASLEEDLKRRDFTINAMAYRPQTGVVDLFGGLEDLEKGVIRAVGDPRQRFEEDALRILRAVRFSGQLGFTLDEATAGALKEFAPRLKKVSAERIRSELTKLLCSPHPENFRLLWERGITAVIFPLFDEMMAMPQNTPYHCMNVGEHTLAVLKNCEATPVMRWTGLLHDTGKVRAHIVENGWRDKFPGHARYSAAFAEEFLRELKFDNNTLRRVVKLVCVHDDRYPVTPEALRRELNRVGEEFFPDYLKFLEADNLAKSELAIRGFKIRQTELTACYEEILRRGDCCFIRDLAVGGKDLLAAGIPAGPGLGETLNAMLEEVLVHPEHNTREYLLAHFT